MASPIESSKRKAEENIENGDERQFIKQEGLDEYIENVNQNFDNQNSKKLDEQIMNLDEISNTETEEELENRIKKFDFTTMICSFIFFIIFASLYWIILLS